MKLRGLYDALKIFSDGWNKRPDAPLYFNEKLFTQKQKDDYDKAIQTIYEALEKRHNNQWEGIPEKQQTLKL